MIYHYKRESFSYRWVGLHTGLGLRVAENRKQQHVMDSIELLQNEILVLHNQPKDNDEGHLHSARFYHRDIKYNSETKMPHIAVPMKFSMNFFILKPCIFEYIIYHPLL